MSRLPSLQGYISAPAYGALAPALILSQHGMVALAYHMHGWELVPNDEFWILPLRRVTILQGLSWYEPALAFVFMLAVSWTLAVLSFRRASRSGLGYGLAALSMVPGIQIPAVLVLALLPLRSVPETEDEGGDPAGSGVPHVVLGVLTGAAIVVFAVLVSAVTFGAYGWGLFVLTPFLVGATTAYVANRRVPLEHGQTISLVLAAGALGTLGLLMFALEGLMCIVVVAPLAALMAIAGGTLGRAAAMARYNPDGPVMSVALLPAVFAIEAAMPPAASIETYSTIDVSAPPSEVWSVLTSSDPIASPPGLVGRAGLAYPLRGRIVAGRIGGERLGQFSTGTARERITEWLPGRKLAFTVLDQPPAMEEMSPYRRVHAPHVEGYFETRETSFELEPLANGRTRLIARASHILRLDPVPYWEPLARWAVHRNTQRVLQDIATKAQADAGDRTYGTR